MTEPEYPVWTEANQRLKDELLKAIHRVPFRPFVIRRDDGRRYPISHPEVAYMSPMGWSVVLALPGLGTLALLPLRILAAIEYPPTRTTQSIKGD